MKKPTLSNKRGRKEEDIDKNKKIQQLFQYVNPINQELKK